VGGGGGAASRAATLFTPPPPPSASRQVFYYALKSVVHPTAPLFDPGANGGAGALRPAAVRALRRVFAACDADGDGALSDAELNAFQVRCFAAPLSAEELAGVKQVVADRVPAGVTPAGLALPGFLFLHALFIERGRLETTWAVLRTYGYGDDLALSGAALAGCPTGGAPDQATCLTPAAAAFFARAFARADRDGDGELAPAEEADLWASAPGPPLKAGAPLAPRGPRGGLTLPGLLAALHALAADDPTAAAAAALYAGMDARAKDVVALSRPRRAERRGAAAGGAGSPPPPPRPLLRGLVFGPDGPGKDAAVATAAGAPKPPAGAPRPLRAAGPAPPPPPARPATAGGEGAAPDVSPSAPPPGGAGAQFLELAEVPAADTAAVAADPARLAAADVAAFVFAAGDAASFEEAHAALLTVAEAAGPGLPCVLVAAGDDAPTPASAAAAAAVAAACGALDVRLPVPLSAVLEEDAARCVAALAAAARGGPLATPLTPALRARRARERALRRALLAAAGGAAAAAAVWAVWRAARPAERGAAGERAAAPARG